jgi:hypothetical protein
MLLTGKDVGRFRSKAEEIRSAISQPVSHMSNRECLRLCAMLADDYDWMAITLEVTLMIRGGYLEDGNKRRVEPAMRTARDSH